MMLTQKQQLIVKRYLQEIGDSLGDVSDETRERALRRAKDRVFAELRKREGILADEEVEAILANIDAPPDPADTRSPKNSTRIAATAPIEDRRWLGVCAAVADYFGLNTAIVRAAFLLLGCTGPVALIIYLALYIETYLASDHDRIPRIDWWRLTARTVPMFVAPIAMDIAVRTGLHYARQVYERVAGLGPFPELGHWNWLPINAAFLLFTTLATTLPLAVLSGLPLANDWDRTLKRCAQAVLALYAAILAIGIALFLTGIIIHLAKGVTV